MQKKKKRFPFSWPLDLFLCTSIDYVDITI